ncbi:hypothetical protein GX408_00515 [bacterium]|nr:hypothetical protein [bacterium]
MGLAVIVFLGLVGCAKKPSPAEPLHGLLYNYDSTELFFSTPPEHMNARVVDDQIDLFAQAGVTVLMCNVNAQRTNYASDCFDSFWTGHDPQAGDDQPFLQDMAPQSRAGYRNMISSMRTLHEQGVDYPAHVIARCRHHGISPWISLRMNDTHNNNEVRHPIHSTFWKEHPEYWRVQGRRIDYYDRTLDYSHHAVRDRFWRLIEEVLQRYDMDGLELDFMREPYLFKPGHEQEGGKILTVWLQEVRKLVKQTAGRRGHAIKMGVRVPADPVTAQNLGLDAVHWAEQGLVDLIVVTPRWATIDTQMPLMQWKRMLAAYPVTLAGGLEIREQAYPDGPARIALPQTAIGAALGVLSSGADVVYLFNYFSTLTRTIDYWPQKTWLQTLRALSSIDTLASLPRRHLLTFHDVFAPGEATDYPLPAKGPRLFFRVITGPKPVGRPVQAVVELAPLAGETVAAPALAVNSAVCDLQGREQNVFTYSVAQSALQDQVQVVEIADVLSNPIQVVHVEITVAGR